MNESLRLSFSETNSYNGKMFNPDFNEFLQLLADHNVEYLVVGGYAVGYYGYPRYTGDLDIMTTLDGVKFNDCYSGRVTAKVDGVPVSMIALEDLKKNKETTGRPRDRDDLQNLL